MVKLIKLALDKRTSLTICLPTLPWLSRRQDGETRSVRLGYLLPVSILLDISGTPGPNDMLC